LAAIHGDFAVRTLPLSPVASLRLGGDIVLAGSKSPAVTGLPWPAEHSDLVVANLEGIPFVHATLAPARYNFAFPAERLAWLKSSGLSAVGLANNHAGDAGSQGVSDGVTLVEKAGLGAFGAGENLARALQPWEFELHGLRFAFLAVACVESLGAGASSGGVATFPAAGAPLAQAINQAKRDGAIVVVFAHWGSEYSHEPDEEQRSMARWLIDRGADVVAGAHPHVRQPLDFYRGKCVAYALGNLVFPAELNRLGEGAWLNVEFDAQGAITRAALEPVSK
jgi:poly-gamma-glutamate synthesis protein (capsule biosynthesis protein)